MLQSFPVLRPQRKSRIFRAGCEPVGEAAGEASRLQPLFPTKKGVTLTKEGEALYFHVASGYEQILLGERRLEEMLDFETGEVRIGANRYDTAILPAAFSGGVPQQIS